MHGDLPALDPVEVRGPVRTSRLVLRPITPDDVVALDAYAASPGARAHLAGSASDPGRMLAERLGWTRLAAVGDRLALAARLGMRREGLLVHDRWVRGAWADTVVVALLDVEWAARTSLDGP